MKLLVLGATGGTGREVISQVLEQGHDVTAFVRDPGKMTSTQGGLRVVVGSVTDDEAAVAQVMRGQDVVVSALGVRQSFRSSNLISRSMRTIVPAMEGQGVRRLIVVSTRGVGDSARDAPLLPRLIYCLLLRDIFADKKAGEDYLRRSALVADFILTQLGTSAYRRKVAVISY